MKLTSFSINFSALWDRTFPQWIIEKELFFKFYSFDDHSVHSKQIRLLYFILYKIIRSFDSKMYLCLVRLRFEANVIDSKDFDRGQKLCTCIFATNTRNRKIKPTLIIMSIMMIITVQIMRFIRHFRFNMPFSYPQNIALLHTEMVHTSPFRGLTTVLYNITLYLQIIPFLVHFRFILRFPVFLTFSPALWSGHNRIDSN